MFSNWASSMLFAQSEGGSLFLSPPSSTVAPMVDSLFSLIFWISAFFFALIVGLMVLFVVKYRRRNGVEAQKTAHHNLLLEAAWSIIPIILVVVIFVEGVLGYLDLRNPPDDAYEIRVTGRKWNWAFQYPNGHVENNLHVPMGVPVRLVMTSEDVIHSLYIPAFRVKMDLVPERYTKAWFEATRPGTYRLYCAEYCGTEHSNMTANVVVHEPGEFEAWLEDASNFLDKMPPAEAGKLLYERRGCIQCHTIDGTSKTGPSFRGIFGTQQPLADGSTVTVDENYIRESILEPLTKVRAGYRPVMPTYRGQLKDAEISAIIEFIKSLK